MAPNNNQDRQKILEVQTSRSRIYFVKQIFKANHVLNGFIVTRKNNHSIRFFRDTEKLNQYIIRLGERDIAEMLNSFVFQCSVTEKGNFIIKYLS